ncbi:MAG TPA: hypothetical protein ENI23_03740 [bacterium]|nr:hypothetical protein [bacterium]
MPPQNTGSFGATIGGADALKASMGRRGIDASLLDQISPAAPTGPSEVAPALPADAGVPSPVTGGAPAAPTGAEKVPFRSGEAEIAIKALKSVIDTENKIAEAVLGLR